LVGGQIAEAAWSNFSKTIPLIVARCLTARLTVRRPHVRRSHPENRAVAFFPSFGASGIADAACRAGGCGKGIDIPPGGLIMSLDNVSRNPAVDFALDANSGQIPEEARAHAALLLLDTLGVAAAARDTEAGRIVREMSVRHYAPGPGAEVSHILFDGRPASIPGAAFAAASQTDNLDAHDGFNPTKGHIGVAVIPAMVAVAEHLSDLSGRAALDALVVGYEVAGRAGLALHSSVSDYHTSGAWNALGVAAMAGRLRGATREQLRQALGIAEYHGPRSQMMREIANPTMLHDGSGMGAFVGLSAVLLAEMGFTGAPAITIEAEEQAHIWSDLGERWTVSEQYIKPYPICRWAHAAIDGAAKIVSEAGITAGDIERITVNSFNEATKLFPGMPQTTSEAQYSLPFAVASMIVHGKVGVDQITGTALSDQTVAGLVARTEMHAVQKHIERFPVGRWADVTIRLKDGREFVSGDVPARGGAEAPMSTDDIEAKFLDFAGPALGTKRSLLIRDAILGLTEPRRRFEDILPLLVSE
jgi:2-methylcitrate dehydratase PrpD